MDAAALDFNLDVVIRRLLTAVEPPTSPSAPTPITQAEIRHLCSAAKKVLLSQPTLLELPAPINICGDIHGQYLDLLRIFRSPTGAPSATNRYLFLGDYVDRGSQSVETICLLLAYKLKYPNSFFLLRGNHECETVNESYGFYMECQNRRLFRQWKDFNAVFACLPLAAALVVAKGKRKRMLCVHGGCRRSWRAWTRSARLSALCPSSLSPASAHEMKATGYDNQFADGKLVTVFSAPNYCGTYGNDGAVMAIAGNLACSFHILNPIPASAPPAAAINLPL
ncbi:unnamed protein product [Alopecurus aequalis]